MASSSDDRIQHYPRKLTCVLSSAKIVSGCGLLATGASALYVKASYGDTASGIWAGTLVIISGVFGIFSVLRNASRPYVLGFFVSCVLSLIASVLVIIYSATGLARDSGFKSGFARDMKTDQIRNIPERELAMLVNLVLILLGVLDVLFTLPSCIICLRDLCECYSADSLLLSDHRSGIKGSFIDTSAGGGTNSNGSQSDWLMSWLGQQNPVFYSTTSGNFPYSFGTKVTTGNSGQPYHLIPAGSSGRRTTTPPFVLIPSDPSQMSAPPNVPIPMSPGLIKPMSSPTRRIGTQGSNRHSRRDHHSPNYQHSGLHYQHPKHQERYESVSSSKKNKRRSRPQSGSPYYRGSNPEHHLPRPRPHSTPNTMYSTSPNSRMTEAPYSPVGVYTTLPPPSHHPQYIYASPHPQQIASYPSPGSHFSHPYPAQPPTTGGPQLLQISPWPMISTPEDYEAYLAGALHTQPQYNPGVSPQKSHRETSDEVDSAVGSQKRSRRHSRHHQPHKGHYGQHQHQMQMYQHPYNYQYQQLQKRQRSKSTDKRFKKISSSSGRESKKKGGPSDSDLDRTYTGLDRELAEEFIEQTMDPSSAPQQISSSALVHHERKRPGSKTGGSSHGGLSPNRVPGRNSGSRMSRLPTSAGDDETQEESVGDGGW